jgi:hypothetical protein
MGLQLAPPLQPCGCRCEAGTHDVWCMCSCHCSAPSAALMLRSMALIERQSGWLDGPGARSGGWPQLVKQWH